MIKGGFLLMLLTAGGLFSAPAVSSFRPLTSTPVKQAATYGTGLSVPVGTIDGSAASFHAFGGAGLGGVGGVGGPGNPSGYSIPGNVGTNVSEVTSLLSCIKSVGANDYDFALTADFVSSLVRARGFGISRSDYNNRMGGSREALVFRFSDETGKDFYETVASKNRKLLMIDPDTFEQTEIEYAFNHTHALLTMLLPNVDNLISRETIFTFRPEYLFGNTWGNSGFSEMYASLIERDLGRFEDCGFKLSSSGLIVWNGYKLTSGKRRSIYLNVDDRFSLAEIKTKIKALDFFGVDVSFTLTSSTYKVGSIGSFVASLSATDSYGNISTGTLDIVVRDYTAPTIVKNSDLEKASNEKVTMDDVLACFDVKDNIALKSYVVFDADGVTPLLDSTSGNLTEFSKPVGSYKLKIEARDSSDNLASCEFFYQSLDVEAPVISSKFTSDTHLISITSAYKSLVDRILAEYTAVDLVDGAISLTIKGTIDRAVGSYPFKLTCHDRAGNEASKTVTFEVKNDMPPVFELSEDLYLTSVDNPLSREDLLNLASEKEGLKLSEVTSYTINDRKYRSATKPGTYPIVYKLSTAESERLGSISVEVVGEKPNWFIRSVVDPVANFFRALGAAISGFFTGKGWTFQL